MKGEETLSSGESSSAIEAVDTEVKSDGNKDEVVDPRRSGIGPIRGLLLLAALIGLVINYKLYVAGVVVIGILISVVLHEAGHFLVARKSGMKCTEFFAGFGPRIWSFKRGDTEYGIKALPFGGYVKIIGMHNLEEVDSDDEHRSYRAANYGRRIATILAGPMTNILIAVVLAIVMLTFVGETKTEGENIVGEVSSYSLPKQVVEMQGIACVADNKVRSVDHCTVEMPAVKSGLKKGDQIVSINGVATPNFSAVSEAITAAKLNTVSLTVKRGNETINTELKPIAISIGDDGKLDDSTGKLGIRPEYESVKLPIYEAVPRAVSGIGSASVSAVKSLANFASPSTISNLFKQASQKPGAVSISDPAVESRPISVLGVVKIAQQENSFQFAFAMLIGLNLFLGVINLVPLLPLDGGHILVATYERLRSRRGHEYRVDMAKLLPVMYTTIFIFALLGLTTIYLDASHPIVTR